MFVYRLCRHIIYNFRPGTGAPGDTALLVLVRPYGDRVIRSMKNQWYDCDP